MAYEIMNIMKLEKREWSGYDNKAGRMRKLGNVQKKITKDDFSICFVN